MQKLFTVIIIYISIVFSACHADTASEKISTASSQDNTSILPVTEFLKGQLREIDSLPITPLKAVIIQGKTDSAWLKREDIRVFAAPFLTPVIDSISMSPYFSGKSFLDQTINAFTFSFDPKVKLPDSINLSHWDVYVDPQDGTIKRIYMVKDSANTTTQFTWQTGKWCSIRTITQTEGKEPHVREEKLIWDF